MSGERVLPGIGLKGFHTIGSNGWGPDLSENARKLSLFVQCVAASRATPIPASAADGVIMIVPIDALSEAGHLAARDNGAWVYYVPPVGFVSYVSDESKHVKWTGSAWSDLSSAGASVDTSIVAINTSTVAAYTLILADAGKVVRCDNASANTLTIPPNSTVAFPVGTVVHVRSIGLGQTTLVAGLGVTVSSAETLKLRKKFSGATLHKVATNAWEIVGDMELLP